MKLDPILLEILACPCSQHAPLREGSEALVCTRCETSFPVRDDIPVMLLDEASPGPKGVGADLSAS
jgi:uncharacterized protein YbaR (Trm112 family)